MDIIKQRRNERLDRIKQIELAIFNAVKEEKEIDKNKLIIGAMSNLGISRRTAKEYVDIALFNQGIDLNGKM